MNFVFSLKVLGVMYLKGFFKDLNRELRSMNGVDELELPRHTRLSELSALH